MKLVAVFLMALLVLSAFSFLASPPTVFALIRDVAVTRVLTSASRFCRGLLVNITITAKNLGNVSESFDIKAYYNDTLIETDSVDSLPSNGETNVTVTWDTSAVPVGNYTIKGEATTVPFEYNTTNNVCIDGVVEVLLTETVYIKADGSITPDGVPIVTSDKITYNFTGDITYPTYYGVVVQRSNIVIDGKGHAVQGNQSGNGLDLTNMNNVTVKNTNVQSFERGIYLYYSSNSTVTRNNATANSYYGINLHSSNNNTVTGNNATANSYDGIILSYSSSKNTISGNDASANRYSGIVLSSSSNNNTVTGNNATANSEVGIYLSSSSNNTVAENNIVDNRGDALELAYSSNNTITGNNVKTNVYGIYLGYSSNNTLSRNYIANNGFGVELSSSSNTSSIFHNDFVQNTIQAWVDSSCYGNAWDNGYPSGGNFWSNYTGVDFRSGPYQNLTGSDGIGDTNHTINAGNVDRYPVIHVYGSVQNLNTSLIYLTIQSAISATETVSGHVIYVKQGTYVENVIVGKSVSLLGEDRETTIINGNTTLPVVQISSDRVTVSGFTVQNGTDGILINVASNCTVCGNKVTANQFGLDLYYSTNNTVIGNNVTANSIDGVYLESYSKNNTVSGNFVTANTRHGIVLWYYCDNNTINANNVISNHAVGLMLYYCSNNTVSGNNLTANSRGIDIEASSNSSRIFHNNFVQNTVQATIDSPSSGNVWDDGYPSGGNYWSNYTGVDVKSGPYQNLTGSDGIGDTNQTIEQYNVDHYPLIRLFGSVQNLNTSLIYLTIQSAISADKTLSGHVIYVKQGTYNESVIVGKSIILMGEDMETTIINGNTFVPVVQISSDRVTVSGFTVQNGTDGILINAASNCTLRGNKVTANQFGIYLSSSNNDTVAENNVTANTDEGIYLYSSSNNTIARNNATANMYDGIALYSSSNNNTLIGNNATANTYVGIGLYSSSNNTVIGNNATSESNGIRLDSSSNSDTVAGNNASADAYGIIIISSSSNNTVTGNNLTGNSRGIDLVLSSNSSRIFHNNFVQNTVQAIVDSSCFNNVWDDGYPSGGNYWSNYTGVDVESGPYQNLTGSDGVGDTNQTINADNVDHYPLMGPYGAVPLSVTISPTSVNLQVGQSQRFTATVSGGTLAYAYQWYLNGMPVPGAVFSNWTFTPASIGSYRICVEVNDGVGSQATSNMATVTVLGAGGGGGRTPYCS